MGVNANRSIQHTVRLDAALPAFFDDIFTHLSAVERAKLRHIGAGVCNLIQRIRGGEITGVARPPVSVAQSRPVTHRHIRMENVLVLAADGLQEGVLSIYDRA